MENLVETYKKSESTDNANNPSHYILMAVGVFVSVLGAIGILFVVVNDLPFKALLFIGMITVLSAIGFFRCYEAMKKMKEVQSSAEPNIDDTV